MHRDTWLRIGWLALWTVGLAAGTGLLALTLSDESVAGHRVPAVMSVVAGLSFMASGLVAWRRRPSNRLGGFMVGLGMTWLAAQLMVHAHWPLVFTAGLWANDAWVVPLALFLVSFPEGRPSSRADRLLVAPFALVLGPLELVWLLFFDPGPPGNVIQVWNDPRRGR